MMNQKDVYRIKTVIVGQPLVPIELLGFSEEWDRPIRTEERYLPQILTDIGFAPSNNETKRNRKDLVRNLDKPDFETIKMGRKALWLIVGQ